MKKLFKNWNLFEIIFLICSILVLTICFAVASSRNWFSFVVSIVGVTSVMFVAKGLTVAPVIDIIYCILYTLLSLTQHYYGEAIVYLLIMIPLNVFCIVSWFRNKSLKNKSLVKVNKLSKKELFISFIMIVPVSALFYFLLKLQNTNQLFISTISLATGVYASYLAIRRCSYYALGFIANDIILIILWTLAVINSGIGYLPSAVSFVVFLANDIYGFAHWKMEEKNQSNENKLNC